MLEPATYQALLKDADAVVHSSGILIEADYKGVLLGMESIWAGLSRAFSTSKLGSQNPLERESPEEPLWAQEKDGQFTYELMNRDTGTSVPNSPKTPINPTNHQRYSHRSRPILLLPIRPFIRLHLRRSRRPPATKAIHNHQTRRRIHHRLHLPPHAQHLHPTRLSLRFLSQIYLAHRFLRRCGAHH